MIVTFDLLTLKLPSHVLAPCNTCANLPQNWRIRFQMIVFTSLLLMDK